MNTVGERIKEARQEKGLSQEELARIIGSTKSAISRYESGKRKPNLEQLKDIARALNADIVYLISGQTSAEVERGILIQAEAEAKYHAKVRFTEAEIWKTRVNEIGKYMAKLSDEGQIEAVKRVKELTQLDEYRQKPEPSPLSAGIKVYGDGPAGSFPPKDTAEKPSEDE